MTKFSCPVCKTSHPPAGPETAYDPVRAGKIIAGILDDAGDLVSGLRLEEIGEDGHAVANLLWKIAGHLRHRGASR